MKNDIKLIPKDERPREKALKLGVESLSNLELIEIVVGKGTKDSSVIDISYELLSLFNGLKDCYMISLSELINIKGISKIKGIEILSILELSKRINYSSDRDNNESMSSPMVVYEKYKGKMLCFTQERMMILYLNNKNIVIKEELLFVGGVDFINIDPKLIFHNAIKYNAKGIICMHNHPSGDVTPSKNDIRSTNQIRDMACFLGINLLDHIIIGNNFYSFKENDLL